VLHVGATPGGGADEQQCGEYTTDQGNHRQSSRRLSED
jgi:hypothetical protein